MSLTAPPNQHQSFPSPRPAPSITQRFAREYRHWADMPPQRLARLLLPICVLVYLDPLLPVVAYVLWLWASSSWAWRDRWTSVWTWAKQGSWLVAFFLTLAVLGAAHVWMVPQLLAALQAFWEAHLPGDLSLSPLDLNALLTRTLLLLPLAPALALYYEHIDPRTRVQLQRVLTPTDLVEPQTFTAHQAPPPPTAQEKPEARAKRQAPSAPKALSPRQPKRRGKRPPPQQTTIEGFLAASDATPSQQRSPSRKTTTKPVSPDPSAKTPPLAAKSIDWDDVAD